METWKVYLVALTLMGLQIGCTSTQKEEPKIAGAAFFPPIQYPSREVPIMADRTSIIVGDHDVVHGLDKSFVGNFVNKEFKGVALSGVFHSTRGKAEIMGLQVSTVANLNHGATTINCIQLAAGINYAGSNQSVYGFQLAGLGNFGGKNKVYGFQVGAFNQAEAIYGIQIGLINTTKNLHGIQIGALNFSGKNGLPIFPVINVGF